MDEIIIEDKVYVNKSFMIIKKYFGVFCGTLTEGDHENEIIADEIPSLEMARGFIHGYIEAWNKALSANYEDVSADLKRSLVTHGKDDEKFARDFSEGFYLCILNENQDAPNEDETEFMFYDYDDEKYDGPYYSWADLRK